MVVSLGLDLVRPGNQQQDVLNWLLAIQDQSKDSAEQTLDLWRRHFVNNTSFYVLWSDMGKLGWEGCAEARSVHDNKLY